MLWNQWYFIYFACMKDKNVAAILAFFLGGLGVHRFYLNQIGLGFVYLIFPVLVSRPLLLLLTLLFI